MLLKIICGVTHQRILFDGLHFFLLCALLEMLQVYRPYPGFNHVIYSNIVLKRYVSFSIALSYFTGLGRYMPFVYFMAYRISFVSFFSFSPLYICGGSFVFWSSNKSFKYSVQSFFCFPGSSPIWLFSFVTMHRCLSSHSNFFSYLSLSLNLRIYLSRSAWFINYVKTHSANCCVMTQQFATFSWITSKRANKWNRHICISKNYSYWGSLHILANL